MYEIRFIKPSLMVFALLISQACVTVPKPGTGACQGPVFTSDEVDQPPQPEKRVQPQIPTDVARKVSQVLRHPSTQASAQVEGETKLKYTVNTDGSLCQISIVKSSGFEELDEASLLAIKQWRFKPAIRNGLPVRAETEQTIEYIFKSQ